jgi:pimeloyl-ACP methyl ester carboxylesterase/DNA-binding CsgD family transcriptional regulator
MEQVIGFCQTEDGVRIAYATVGRGPTVVYVTGWPVHLELEWSKPFARNFLTRLAADVMLVRYDMRGSGLSDRNVDGFSIDALMRDLNAVIENLGLTHFALLGLGDLAGPLAITYAATHQDRVTHLILHSAYARGSDLATRERQEATINYVEMFGFPTFDFVDAPGLNIEMQRDVREINEAACSHAVQASLLRTMFASDVTHLLNKLSMPILLLHARNDPWIPLEAGRELAIRLPHARFVPFEGTSISPWVHEHVLLPEIRRFLLGAALEVAVPGSASARVDADHVPLTPRELEVLYQVAIGRSSHEIAEALALSRRTVERHLSNVYAKIGVTTRAQATAYAYTHGLVGQQAT